LRDFPGFRVSARFSRDGGDGEADRSSGPRRAQDFRPVADRGVGKARMVLAEVRCRRDSRHARRGERGENSG
jgi:hypothetical protein